ncbi:hypothetical protein MKW94_008044 [Papaver nudicaule]|uniref:Transferase n=1 Tax=Papaver nudicaule TaxID=74823 RepID=A0AA42B2L0_PAPNU|nr:hypothetical protein [Papaver nudicaule]
MERMKVELVLKQTIKPSIETPPHSKTFKLSFLDQHLAPPIYIPFTLYYEFGNNSNSTSHCHDYLEEACKCRVEVIKQSLSETLTRYYPLAGRMKDGELAVNCNDEGVEYFETRVSNIRLSQVIVRSPDHNSVLRQLLPPCKSSCDGSMSIPFDYGFKSKTLLAVQVNVFECGGMVIGMCMAHKLADASSLFTFIADWAARARGATEDIKGPSFDFSYTLFPQKDVNDFKPFDPMLRREEELVTKCFVFSAPKIAQLKKRNVGNIICQRNSSACTRVEAVTSFLWKRYMDSVRAKNPSVENFGALCTVNLRPRITPPLPGNSFGNIYSFAIALSAPSDDNYNNDDEFRKDISSPNDLNLVGKIRDAIKKVGDKYTRRLQSSEDELVNDVKPLTSGEAIFFGFSSWCRFPIYEADFGWGKPVWASIGTIALQNTAFLMDAGSGDGIEAFVNMTREDMDEFEIKLLADQ